MVDGWRETRGTASDVRRTIERCSNANTAEGALVRAGSGNVIQKLGDGDVICAEDIEGAAIVQVKTTEPIE